MATDPTRPPPGSIDCDVHPHVPGLGSLAPYLDDFWADMVETRGIDGYQPRAWPPGAELSCRPDWRGAADAPGGDVATLRANVLDRWGCAHAILSCLYGIQQIHDEQLGAALATALNDWLAAEWLAADPRLRASIVVPMQAPDLAVAEIERRAGDRRFVQVLLLGGHDLPLGKRHWWPIYAAAERHGLPVGIHLGSAYRHAPSAQGWPSFHSEDYVDQATGMQAQLASLIAHGVFQRHPKLTVVLLESGVTWVPAFLWRFGKFWRGLRIEIPWVDRPPIEIARDHVRLTLQPLDAPPAAAVVERVLDQLGSDDMLLFASDYPHWQFEGDGAIPGGIAPGLLAKLTRTNALATYPRLGDAP
jgi:hypothetical protein